MPSATESAQDQSPATPPVTSRVFSLPRFESYSVRKVLVFDERDEDGAFESEHWRDSVPPEHAGCEPVREFWRLVGHYRDEVNNPGQLLFEGIEDDPRKMEPLRLYARLTGCGVTEEMIVGDGDVMGLPTG